ncbi:hypothetical protein DA792_09025 [Celeribacter baekdonensis]|uniref:Uncharacterized protein n=1 Tax=Celeribacter baekdonensis TaxID=875171 RepID=A0A2R4M210_9RHOB|nr:hypothetical protein DA792_09025 [Celeribacter baekdonensis]
MHVGEEVVEDYAAVRLSLKAHRWSFCAQISPASRPMPLFVASGHNREWRSPYPQLHPKQLYRQRLSFRSLQLCLI